MAKAAAVEEETGQATLLDLDSRELNAYWVDPAQPLIIPVNPLHWKAHELQMLLQILKKQALKNPAQFNSKNYIDTLTEYTRCITLINKGEKDEALDTRGVVGERAGREQTPAMGERTPVSVGSGVSADNPFAG